MGLKLFPYQIQAICRMRNGCILNGGVGSGKSLTSLAYYYLENGGSMDYICGGTYVEMQNPKDLIIITTARKRDTFEWDGELSNFLLSRKPDLTPYKNNVIVDSWNNISKYAEVKSSFFIFDEQRLIGNGVWTKTFLKIAKSNDWILLSATPGDTWSDYITVFIANGFFKNRSEFIRDHIVYAPMHGPICYPKIDRYINISRLIRLRDRILVDMDFKRTVVQHHETIYTDYDKTLYKSVLKTRKDPYSCIYVPGDEDDINSICIGGITDPKTLIDAECDLGYELADDDYVKLESKPIESASSLCYVLRRICNQDVSRSKAVLDILDKHPRVIVFYNFDYELTLLKNLAYPSDVELAEWNGHKHQPIPDTPKWVYLVQYVAGCEGWNCISTNAVIFYSQNYSYKVMEQASGRINRLNTPFSELWYYHLQSHSNIDNAISNAISKKKKFNERRYYDKL